MNAIIMAAGTSSRFAPLSYEKPKGLLCVKGEILIERQIRQLREAGIYDITIVVGYKAEQFMYLKDKYGVDIIINKEYNIYNNTSSIMRVIDRLEDTFVCSSDNYFQKNVFLDKPISSYYSALYSNDFTKEYCIEADEDNNIVNVTIGGECAWYMVGHVFFNKEFSSLFREIMINEYCSQKTRNEYWEDVYIRNIEHLPKMKIRRYSSNEIAEFDSLDELREFDSDYINNTGCKVFKNICEVLNCEERDIFDIHILKKGMTNSSFCFTCRKDGQKYVYRHPGEGTEKFINRDSEFFSMQVAKKLELDRTFIYMHPTEGWKISYFIENARALDYHNISELKEALRLLARLHNANIQSDYSYRLWDQANDFFEKIKLLGKDDTNDFYSLRERIEFLYQLAQEDSWPECLNHCDALAANFLIDANKSSVENNMILIDWEYSGQGDTAQDLGSFIACSDMSYIETMQAIEIYLGHVPTKEELRHYLAYTAIASYCWYLWAIYQEANGVDIGEFKELWYKYVYQYSDKAKELYIDKV